MLFLLHSNLHYAVLSVHLRRLYDSHGATSVDMTIYDSKCADSSSSSSSRLSDDAIKLRWQPQVAVVQRLLAGAGVGNTTLSVADTLEQEDGSNNCGVHSIMYMEALVNEDPALAQQALQSINAEAASMKRELIRECWMSRSTLPTLSTPLTPLPLPIRSSNTSTAPSRPSFQLLLTSSAL